MLRLRALALISTQQMLQCYLSKGSLSKRLGELVAVLVKLKPGYTGKVNEKTLLALAKKL